MQSNILLVDDSPAMNQLTAQILSGLGTLRSATDGMTALQLAREQPPDLILLDAEMPGMSGFQACEALKADPVLRDVPVIFVTGHSGSDFELKSFEIGAADFIVKPISPPVLAARVQTQLRIKHLNDELRHIATIDALTELDNRRRFDNALAREWKRTLRAGHPLSVLLVDVDHFKLFNDRYGHPSGDVCLRSVAQALRSATLRPADVVARYGGEEFALLLPQTPRLGAEHLAHRVLDAVESLAIANEVSPTARHVTVSVGMACYDEASRCWIEPSANSRLGPAPPRNADDLTRSADQALYAAKRGGRAQAWWLDIDDVDAPALAREIEPWNRAARARNAP